MTCSVLFQPLADAIFLAVVIPGGGDSENNCLGHITGPVVYLNRLHLNHYGCVYFNHIHFMGPVRLKT